MHIPDGYLGPRTYLAAYAVMVPFWSIASKRLQQSLRARQVPLLALGAAFSFLIMMFNVPVPGGTTAHAVGAVLVAVLLGPWAAVIAISLALAVQALLFGDGGITALGANCFNMALVMPWVGWSVYRIIAGRAPTSPRRQWLGAAVGGYLGLNAAALSAAVMFGLQPWLAHDAAGHALYCPFGLQVAVPAMCGAHLLIGLVEALVTGLVVVYLQRVEPQLLRSEAPAVAVECRSPWPRLAGGVVLLMLLSPLGLFLPAWLGSGSAWGEWSADEIQHLAGYVPGGLQHLGSFWHAPLPDYALPGQESASLVSLSWAYLLSAVVGTALVLLAVWGWRKLSLRSEA